MKQFFEIIRNNLVDINNNNITNNYYIEQQQYQKKNKTKILQEQTWNLFNRCLYDIFYIRGN